jgi:hypothetical protein
VSVKLGRRCGSATVMGDTLLTEPGCPSNNFSFLLPLCCCCAACVCVCALQEQDGQLCGPPPLRPAASIDEEDASDQQLGGIINGSQLLALLSRMSAS